MKNQHKTIGIIGGVGPLATADFFAKLLRSTSYEKDQDYPRVLVDCYSQIPDRTLALVSNGESPVEKIAEAGNNLIQAGAEVLCLPCNTAHAWAEEIQDQLSVPLVNIVDETVAHIQSAYPEKTRIGILATTGTRAHGLYDKKLRDSNLEPIHVTDEMQAQVMQAIYGKQGIKSGFLTEAKELLDAAISQLHENGAQLVILGCTELPLVLKDGYLPYVDTSQVLADAVLRESRNERKPVRNQNTKQVEAKWKTLPSLMK